MVPAASLLSGACPAAGMAGHALGTGSLLLDHASFRDIPFNMGIFLVFTSIVIAIPVVSELLEGGRKFRELASPSLLAIGLFAAGVAFWFVSPEREMQVAWAGVIVALVGLMLRPSDSESAAEAREAHRDAMPP